MAIFFLVLFLAVPVFSSDLFTAEITECQVPKNSVLNWNESEVSGLNLRVQFSSDKVQIENEADTNIAYFLVNNTRVMIEGLSTKDNSTEPPQKINFTLIVQFEGYGRLVANTNQSITKLENCGISEVKLWENKLSPSLLYLLIAEYTHSCVGPNICDRINHSRNEEYINSTNSYKLGTIQVKTQSENQTNTVNLLNKFRKEEMERIVNEENSLEEENVLNMTQHYDFIKLMLNDTTKKTKTMR